MPVGILNPGSGVDGILGLDQAVLALKVMMVDPGIRSVLIRGPLGVGKSALVRGFSMQALGKPPVIVPANTDSDRMFGSLDLESALSGKGFGLESGLLSEADGGIMCIDDVDRLDQGMVREAMGCVRSGRVRIERDGLSADYRTDTHVVATSSSSGGYMSPSVREEFDICVHVRPSDDPDFRDGVSRLALSGDSADGRSGIAEEVSKARGLLPEVIVPDGILTTIVDACIEFATRGYGGEFATYRTCRALAALEGRTVVDTHDAAVAMLLCLEHRRTRRPRKESKPETTVRFFSGTHMKRFIHDDRKPSPETKKTEPDPDVPETVPETMGGTGNTEVEDVILEIGEMFESIDLFEEARMALSMDAVGRRMYTDDLRSGRRIGSRIPEGRCTDISVEATLRAAAPYQAHREGDGVVITSEDLRENVRERRRSYLYMFMIDTSGSLVIRSRMRAVKAAVFSMLSDHFVRRDSVCIGSFNEKRVGLELPPTKSVERVKNVLEGLSIGEKTPLSDALLFTGDYVGTHVRKHPSESCVVILMTDGMANIPHAEGVSAFEESLAIASRTRPERTTWVVVDTSPRKGERNYALELADALGGKYYRLDDLDSTRSGTI